MVFIFLDIKPSPINFSSMFSLVIRPLLLSHSHVHLRSEKITSFVDHENFKRFFRFGALDQNVLLLGLLTGVGVDSIIQKRFGVAVPLSLSLLFLFISKWLSFCVDISEKSAFLWAFNSFLLTPLLSFLLSYVLLPSCRSLFLFNLFNLRVMAQSLERGWATGLQMPSPQSLKVLPFLPPSLSSLCYG